MTSIGTERRKFVRRTIGALDGNFGADRGKRLVVSFDRGDVLKIRPERTRRPETLHLVDVYRMAVRARVAREKAEKRARRKLA